MVVLVSTKETATLAGGCFWCLEAVFEQLVGVERSVSGYTGGSTKNPSYEEVSGGTTGHAEAVQLTFDPRVTGYDEILDVFFTIHDPTTRDRQGNDVGSQYRSAIFTHSPEQERTARAKVTEWQKAWERPIVTEVVPFAAFHPAEAYHQGYYRRNPTQGYCRTVVAPKVAKFRTTWAAKLRATA